MKRYLSAILGLFLCFITVTSSSAIIEEGDAIISPDAVLYCDAGYVNHDMITRGWGIAYKSDGSIYLQGEQCWQCTHCYLVMVSEGTIIMNKMTTIGKWATAPFDEPINLNGATLNPATSFGNCSSSSMVGFRFRYVQY